MKHQKDKVKKQYLLQSNQKIKELGINVNIEIIGDMQKMMALGVMRTPALIIDDEVVLQGRIPKKEEIKRLLQK